MCSLRAATDNIDVNTGPMVAYVAFPTLAPANQETIQPQTRDFYLGSHGSKCDIHNTYDIHDICTSHNIPTRHLNPMNFNQIYNFILAFLTQAPFRKLHASRSLMLSNPTYDPQGIPLSSALAGSTKCFPQRIVRAGDLSALAKFFWM